MAICVGVLALQGDFAKHIEMLNALKVDTQLVRCPEDLKNCHGLIIPGGESTVMQRQIDFIKLREPLLQFAKKNPVFGTCAGLILMSKEIQNSSFASLNLLDVSVERNAFGRQTESFRAMIPLCLSNNLDVIEFPAYFIRAPRIRAIGANVQILGTWKNEAVLVREGHFLGSSFHPELTNHLLIHQYFIQMVRDIF